MKKGAAIYNILVYKPGLYSNNQSIVVGANYDSSGRRNNGSGTALLLETARGLKDIPTNHNIYFVAYANGAEPAGKSISSGACVHAGTLSGSIGATNILGMINLEPQKLDAGGERKQPGPEACLLYTSPPPGRLHAFPGPAQCPGLWTGLCRGNTGFPMAHSLPHSPVRFTGTTLEKHGRIHPENRCV